MAISKTKSFKPATYNKNNFYLNFYNDFYVDFYIDFYIDLYNTDSINEKNKIFDTSTIRKSTQRTSNRTRYDFDDELNLLV